MKPRLARLLKALALLFAGLAIGLAGQAAHAETTYRLPNIVVILADDAGYADFGFMGSKEFETPNLDRLAAQGTVFRSAYATTPFCSPSRAGLLTGRYPQRFGYEFNLTHEPPPGVDQKFMGLAVEERTLGALLKERGYSTIAIGKWHVGDQPQFHPNARGFDHFYGFLGGGSSYFPGRIRQGVIERNGVPVAAGEYLTDDFAGEAVEQIEANKVRPFLLYLAFNAVHTPMDATAEDLAHFAHIADLQRRRLAAMTWGLDRAVGRVLDALEANGVAEETLVVFTNDNGGDRIGLDASNAPLRGTKGTLLEGGIRVPMVVRWPARWKSAGGPARSDTVSLMDVVPTALDLAGGSAPKELDGTSLVGPLKVSRPLFWRYDNMAAMREGPWKLLRFPDRPPQLFNLDRDIGERKDLARRERKRVNAMMRALFAWEGTIEHPRWHTGTFWSQEDVRRYSEEHTAAGTAKSKADLTQPDQP